MTHETLLLIATALTLGFVHTLVGPDHYIPFVAMSKARKWTLSKTLWITFVCGLGHIGSSVVLGLVGVGLGLAVAKLEGVESLRGSIAAWGLSAFGFAYFVWGIHRAIRNRPHSHVHVHGPEDSHTHLHTHSEDHVHVHPRDGMTSVTPWVLFTIFVFGPCEPLIPLVMIPAAGHDRTATVAVVAAFGIATILTMLGLVTALSYGLRLVRFGRLERYSHAFAGFLILACGLGIQFLGL